MKKKRLIKYVAAMLAAGILTIVTACADVGNIDTGKITTDNGITRQTTDKAADKVEDLSGIGEYQYEGTPYVALNNNIPLFTDSDLTTEPFEIYSDLDELGRCGAAYANICVEIMPTKERESIGSVKPSGWHTAKYIGIVDGNYLYNRCHLIGFQLSGENANEKNLITGTRYLNVEGMLPFENMVADYVKETDHHVLYRVTPVFEDDNLVASGVIMEAMSVEDKGAGICFNVYVYNVQPGIMIDYKTGESALDSNTTASDDKSMEYVLNTGTHKFHYSSCSSVGDIAEGNRKISTESREKLIADGYIPCKRCNP